METNDYTFVGGPLDGQTRSFTGTATWWGMRYKKNNVSGEYNTHPSSGPYTLTWWEEGTPRKKQPDWELHPDTDVENLEGESLEEHIKRLIDSVDNSSD